MQKQLGSLDSGWTVLDWGKKELDLDWITGRVFIIVVLPS